MGENKSRESIIRNGYKGNSNKYDDYITSRKLWSKIIVKLIWGIRDKEYVNTITTLLPNDFHGKLLDIPTGTAIFTYEKYQQMNNADVFCVDYSQEMLNHAQEKFNALNIKNVHCIQGDVGNLPFENNYFDIVLSMNGFHAFPNKEKAFSEILRVLKSGGKFFGCFYIKGERRISDWFIRNLFVRNGTFTPPFITKGEVELRLKDEYTEIKIWNVKSIVCFQCIKK